MNSTTTNHDHAIGDRVIVHTDLGDEIGIIMSMTNPKFRDRMITVQFSDGTNSTWPILFISQLAQ